MKHLIILPILVPLLSALLLMLPPLSGSLTRQRVGSLVSLTILLGVSLLLLNQAQGGIVTLYALGDWAPPFGILLVADRLSALMLALAAILGLATSLYASADDDTRGRFFHSLLQFQLMGINGAFLTGDLFNLFVFFEVLLIASYALVIHGGGKQKTRANIHYVTLNLVGSSLFLFALGILYGTLGTLNMADMARKVAHLSTADTPLVEVGAVLLLVVFGLKAAAFPLYFWLPATYSAVAAPVAALFAIMSKVGIYALLRVFPLIFGAQAGELADLATPWLWPAAIATIALGALGVLASQDLREQTAYLVIVSVGILLAGVALNSVAGTTALLFYLIHTTLVSAGLFLLVDLIARQRGHAHSRIVSSHPPLQKGLLGTLFLIAALAMIGMPPFSGFLGKLLMLQATTPDTARLWLWPALLLSSLVLILAFSRTGSTLFWRTTGSGGKAEPAHPAQLAATLILLAAAPLMALLAGPITSYAEATALQLHQPESLIHTIFPDTPQSTPGVQP